MMRSSFYAFLLVVMVVEVFICLEVIISWVGGWLVFFEVNGFGGGFTVLNI